jgi:hypothetical protein
MLQQSETTRDNLLVQFEQTSITIKKDASEHSAFQDKLISENQALKETI